MTTLFLLLAVLVAVITSLKAELSPDALATALSYGHNSTNSSSTFQPSTAGNPIASNTVLIKPDNQAFKYYGHWYQNTSATPLTYQSYYGAANFKTIISSSRPINTLLLHLKNDANNAAQGVLVNVGSHSTILPSAYGIVNLSSLVIGQSFSSPKTMSINPERAGDTLFFTGLEIDKSASLKPYIPSRRVLEFVGDSITAGFQDTKQQLSAFPYLVSQALKSELSVLAFPGCCLTSGHGSCCFGDQGMNIAYFKTQLPFETPQTKWTFAYTPSDIFINLGTNDMNIIHYPGSHFQSDYIAFVKQIRQKEPQANIHIFRPFGTYNFSITPPTYEPIYVNETYNVVNTLNAQGDRRVHYINTTNWLTSSDFVSDGVHPSDSGQQKIKTRLLAYLDTVP